MYARAVAAAEAITSTLASLDPGASSRQVGGELTRNHWHRTTAPKPGATSRYVGGDFTPSGGITEPLPSDTATESLLSNGGPRADGWESVRQNRCPQNAFGAIILAVSLLRASLGATSRLMGDGVVQRLCFWWCVCLLPMHCNHSGIKCQNFGGQPQHSSTCRLE